MPENKDESLDNVSGAGSVLSTVSGPSTPNSPDSLGTKNPVGEQLLEKMASSKDLAAAMPAMSCHPNCWAR